MTWTASRVEQLLETLRIRRGDSTLVEVKRAAGGLPQNTAESICAFANMPDGGTIILGIDEATNFTVTGIEFPAEMEAALVGQARSTVEPVPHLRTSSLSVNGKQIVIAEVTPLRLIDKPATVDERAYLRQADGDYVMHEHEIRMIEVEKLLMAEPKSYDSQVISGLTVDDLVPEIVDQYLRSTRSRDRRLADRGDNEILRRTGVITASGEPTLAGLYAMGDYPQGSEPSLTVTAAVQLRTDDGQARNQDLQHFTGPIPVLLSELLAWCGRNIPLIRSYRPDGHMTERPEIPLNAARELLANALVHRDLSPNTLGTGKSVQVRLTPSNLFVQSPGGLRGVSVQQLESEDHAQAAVNQRLYSITRKLDTPDGMPVIEGEGGGVRVVLEAARDYGLRTPALINTGVQFKAILWRPDSAGQSSVLPQEDPTDAQPRPVLPAEPTEKTTRNVPLVLQKLGALGTATFSQLQIATELSRGQLRYAINDAVAHELIEMVGKQGDRGTVYRLTTAD